MSLQTTRTSISAARAESRRPFRIMGRAALWISTAAAGFCAVGAAIGADDKAPPKPKEDQTPVVKVVAPPSPALSPEQELATFKLPAGFHMVCVASEPMVEDPVSMQFDEDGRLWVVEMRGYMPNINADHETDPVGRVSVLEDTNHDGKMDKRTTFLDGLVLPRALGLTQGGVLVAAPPNLYFCKDTNGDLVCDEKTVVAIDYGGPGNVEHLPNGLMTGIDNWVYSADFFARYRPTDGKFIPSRYSKDGQWGITMDDYGRMFFNYNSDFLRANLLPSELVSRNPRHAASQPSNWQVMKDQHCHPARVNPGVNRGYQPNQLQKDGKLNTCTATCGPVIYRGALFPEEYRGNAFIPEPSGNFVKRVILKDVKGVITAQNAYKDTEFLTSTDERFRPVNAFNGPDGALYIVDLYHGILQHKFFLTDYLKDQIRSRNLETPLHMGRIWKIVPDSAQAAAPPAMSAESSAQLVELLSNPNGWTRDTAQRILAGRKDAQAVAPLTALLKSGASPLGRLHALWTLEGMGRLDENGINIALADADGHVRAAAIRCAQILLQKDSTLPLTWPVLQLANDADPQVRLAFALVVSGWNRAEPDDTVAALLGFMSRNAGEPMMVDAAMSGVGGRELTLLERLLAMDDYSAETPGATKWIAALARATVMDNSPSKMKRLLELAAAQGAPALWRQRALLDGMSTAARSKNARQIQLAEAPPALAALLQSTDKPVEARAKKVDAFVIWPGKPGATLRPMPPALSREQQARFDEGRELFAARCAQCHQLNGMGLDGLAPPLAGSQWSEGPAGRMIRIAILGVGGPIKVDTKTFNMEMPPPGVLGDDELASILTYIRREWDNEGAPVTPADVAKVREAIGGRKESWTEKELLEVQ